MSISEIEKILNSPPQELSADDMIAIRYNGFIRKNYLVRWKIEDEQQLSDR